jgi:hypothetical protein
LESNFARYKGRMGKLGQAGTHRLRAGAGVNDRSSSRAKVEGSRHDL